MAISDILASIDQEITRTAAGYRLARRVSAGREEEDWQAEEGGGCTQESSDSCTCRCEAREKEEEEYISRGAKADRRGCQETLGGAEGCCGSCPGSYKGGEEEGFCGSCTRYFKASEKACCSGVGKVATLLHKNELASAEPLGSSIPFSRFFFWPKRRLDGASSFVPEVGEDAGPVEDAAFRSR